MLKAKKNRALLFAGALIALPALAGAQEDATPDFAKPDEVIKAVKALTKEVAKPGAASWEALRAQNQCREVEDILQGWRRVGAYKEAGARRLWQDCALAAERWRAAAKAETAESGEGGG